MDDDYLILTGQSKDHLVSIDESLFIHQEALKALNTLKDKCKKAGFDLQLVSSFRDYQTQLSIWNKKALGQRALLDDAGNPLDHSSLSQDQVMQAILRWSALPGASRHHWGTDIDVFDANSMAKADIQLTPQEVASSGPCGPFHDFLDELICSNESAEFFRPYAQDLNGVAPERWHLSYAPISKIYLEKYTLDTLEKVVSSSTELQLKEIVLDNLEYIYNEFIQNISK